MIGTEIGSYKIIEEIGRGGMTIVYRAYQTTVDRYVAIKMMHRSIVDQEQAIARFQREAQVIACLEHTYLLPLYDFDGGHDPPYLVMRYVESGSLKEVLERGQIPLHEVVYLLNQVTEALDYAHRHGVIHQDLKPSNIMIDEAGNAFCR